MCRLSRRRKYCKKNTRLRVEINSKSWYHSYMIPRLSSNDKRLRSEVWKDLERISDNSTQEELWEIYWDLTQTAESATKIPRSQNRVETRRIIAESIRKVRALLALHPTIPTLPWLSPLCRIARGIENYSTIYVNVGANIREVYAYAQREGLDISKVFVISEFLHSKTKQITTDKRYMWDSETQSPRDVTVDTEAKGIFMDKMNPS